MVQLDGVTVVYDSSGTVALDNVDLNGFTLFIAGLAVNG